MDECRRDLTEIDRYLDDELRGDEASAFRRHLDGCESCQRRLEGRRAFFSHVRESRPSTKAPETLRERVSQMLVDEESRESAGYTPQPQFAIPAGKAKGPKPARWWIWSFPMATAATLAVLFVISILSIIVWRQHARANAFVDMAIATHERHIAGRLPVEVHTGSGTELTAWFSHKVPFHFRLPDSSQTKMGAANYQLSGGRLVALDGHQAAYVAYQMGVEPISLVVASKSDATALGGEALVANSITFHTHRKRGLQIVTWSVHGLTYALVSSVNVPARQSCVVCHSDPKGRELLRKSLVHSGRTLAPLLQLN